MEKDKKWCDDVLMGRKLVVIKLLVGLDERMTLVRFDRFLKDATQVHEKGNKLEKFLIL